MKLSRFFKSLRFLITWIGIIRILLVPCCLAGIYLLIVSGEPLVLKIFGCIVIAFSGYGALILGVPNIKKGMDLAHYYLEDEE